MISVGLIGYGYWGPNMARNIQENNDMKLRIICDSNTYSLQRASQRYPHVRCTDNVKEILNDPKIDAVIIATPANTHFDLASQALNSGKHVLVEKPMTDSVQSALELLELSEKVNRVLMVDHTFIYTPAVNQLKKIVSSGELGSILYYDSIRINLGLFQHDINVIWDLAPHDISIMHYLIEKSPVSVSAQGAKFLNNEIESIAYVHLTFDDGLIAHFHVNWLAPVKIRRTVIGGSKKMTVYDDVEPTEKIKVYDKGIDITSEEGILETLVQYRTGDIQIPHLENREALSVEIDHFKDCIINGKVPITDSHAGLEVVKVLEAAHQSIRKEGLPVFLD